MANTKKIKGVIAILTGGGDVPGLNPATRRTERRPQYEHAKSPKHATHTVHPQERSERAEPRQRE